MHRQTASPYLELHHRVLAEFVSTGGSDLVQADELGLVADAIALKTPDESRLAAILPCRHTHTHTRQYIFQSRTSIYLGPVLLPRDHQSQSPQKTSTVIWEKKQPSYRSKLPMLATSCYVTKSDWRLELWYHMNDIGQYIQTHKSMRIRWD